MLWSLLSTSGRKQIPEVLAGPVPTREDHVGDNFKTRKVTILSYNYGFQAHSHFI